MAKWRYTLDIQEEWDKYEEDKNLQQLCKVIAEKLPILIPGSHYPIELVECFKEMSEDMDATVEQFDYIFNTLYDWADQQVGGRDFFMAEKLCWIKTGSI